MLISTKDNLNKWKVALINLVVSPSKQIRLYIIYSCEQTLKSRQNKEPAITSWYRANAFSQLTNKWNLPISNLYLLRYSQTQ